MEGRVGRVLFPITLGMLWLFTFISLFAEEVREMGPVMPLVAIAGTGLIVGVWFWRQKRRRVHCGTPIRVEVREDGIEVLTLHETHLIPFAEAAYTFSTWSGEYLRFFLGIVLDTPVGRLRIEDGYFEHGTDAAEAIMYLCGDTRHLGVPRLTT